MEPSIERAIDADGVVVIGFAVGAGDRCRRQLLEFVRARARHSRGNFRERLAFDDSRSGAAMPQHALLTDR